MNWPIFSGRIQPKSIIFKVFYYENGSFWLRQLHTEGKFISTFDNTIYNLTLSKKINKKLSKNIMLTVSTL